MWCKNLDLLPTPPWLAPHSWWLFWVGFLLLEEHHPILIQLSIAKTGYTSSRSLGMVRCCQAFSVLSAAWSTWKASTFDAGAARIRGWWSCEWFHGPPLVSKCTFKGYGLTKSGLYICIWLFLVRYCKTCFLEELVLAVQVAMRTTIVSGFPT